MQYQNQIQISKDTYNINGWSGGHFDINPDGELCVKNHNNKQLIPLNKIVESCLAKGLTLPLLLRFSNILQDKVDEFYSAFAHAFSKYNYQGKYCAAYPIKVNQQRRVIEFLLENKHNIGLESGSKPELLAILACGSPQKNILICNGFKDRDYIRLALIGQKMGFEVNIIVEKLAELELIIDEAKKLDVIPRIGLRLRLSSIGKGQWQNTGGLKAKFGLSVNQILKAVECLRTHNALHWLKVLHFFIGSQIANLADIEQGTLEGIKCFTEINKLGAQLDTINVGGGVGVDYNGTNSENYFSLNYTVADYADAVVRLLAANKNIVKNPPRILTECGRAMVAHHAVLITNILSAETILLEQDNNLTLPEVTAKNALKIWEDANKKYKQAQQAFNQDLIDIKERAAIDNFYFTLCQKIHTVLETNNRHHRELIDDLNEKLAHKLICNLSIFQSLPDVWGLDQIFPIMPLSSLNKELNVRAVIHDLTCDSDGSIDNYVDMFGTEKTLPLPQSDDFKYLLGFFLVGAYQEILGDLHNLFGDPNSANVILDNNSFTIEHLTKSEKIADVLRHVDFSIEHLLDKFSKKENGQFLAEIKQNLQHSVYFV